MKTTLADIILPLAVKGAYTYSVPEEMSDDVEVGMRVEVQFGRKRSYAGLVLRVFHEMPSADHPIKPIQAIIDKVPVVDRVQLRFWQWISTYYLCTLGEVMLAALPTGLKLSSTTVITLGHLIDQPTAHHHEETILDALEARGQLTVSDIQELLDRKGVMPIIKRMIDRGMLHSREDIKDQYKPKTTTVIRLSEDYQGHLNEALAVIERYDVQVNLLLAYDALDRRHPFVTQAQLLKRAEASSSSLKSLIKKGIFVKKVREISRLGAIDNISIPHTLSQLTPLQDKAMSACRDGIAQGKPVLLHGVTGSGKTLVFQYLIKEALEQGKQVLYLLPEIGLTYHFIERMKAVFGEAVTTYHSRQNPHARTEVYLRAMKEVRLLIGPRSAVFLPMTNLGLIVVDESHDPSYKQQDPAPRYHGRDAAVVLANMHGCPIIMGTATPSIDTLWNVKQGKYIRATLPQRVRDLVMPEIIVHAMQKSSTGEQETQISHLLKKNMIQTLEEGRQVLIFRNRRGYAPMLLCEVCGWVAQCVNCDVSLTYHKYTNRMRCHYCGYHTPVDSDCPSCANDKLVMRGSGTQKIEETLALILPEARIGRMDADTASGRKSMEKLIHDFEAGELDILVGTQMIAKGLDFENVGLVGVLQADALLYFPDFRSEEKAHHLLTQVAGRAGRTQEGSKVIIQTYQPYHPVFKSLSWETQLSYLSHLVQERKTYHYPPFVRIIEVHFAHHQLERVREASIRYADMIRQHSGAEILGPVSPTVARIRGKYLRQCTIKIKKTDQARTAFMNYHHQAMAVLQAEAWSRSVRVSIDVDPY